MGSTLGRSEDRARPFVEHLLGTSPLTCGCSRHGNGQGLLGGAERGCRRPFSRPAARRSSGRALVLRAVPDPVLPGAPALRRRRHPAGDKASFRGSLAPRMRQGGKEGERRWPRRGWAAAGAALGRLSARLPQEERRGDGLLAAAAPSAAAAVAESRLAPLTQVQTACFAQAFFQPLRHPVAGIPQGRQKPAGAPNAAPFNRFHSRRGGDTWGRSRVNPRAHPNVGGSSLAPSGEGPVFPCLSTSSPTLVRCRPDPPPFREHPDASATVAGGRCPRGSLHPALIHPARRHSPRFCCCRRHCAHESQCIFLFRNSALQWIVCGFICQLP